MKLAYVDSCVWITLIEGLEPYRPAIRGALRPWRTMAGSFVHRTRYGSRSWCGPCD
jgi:hypothetical protein